MQSLSTLFERKPRIAYTKDAADAIAAAPGSYAAVAVVTLEPGDKVVITTDRVLTLHQRDALQDALNDFVHNKKDWLVLEGGLRMNILKGVSNKQLELGS